MHRSGWNHKKAAFFVNSATDQRRKCDSQPTIGQNPQRLFRGIPLAGMATNQSIHEEKPMLSKQPNSKDAFNAAFKLARSGRYTEAEALLRCE